jgi:PAS domain S-box-containing protein
VVIKASIELIEKELGPAFDEIVLVTDPRGVVFISNQPRWRYHLLWQLSQEAKEHIRLSRQFGQGPWPWTGLSLQTDLAVAADGARFLIHRTGLERYPGWHIIHLRSQEAIARSVSRPFIRIVGPIVLTLCVLMGLAVTFLYRKASHEISRRRSVEAALRQSEERYRSIYHNTPAMLHSVDPQGRLVSVSDHWLEALGYRREEVIGKKLTDFFTYESRRLAEEKIFPSFFRNGFCKDVPYQFVKKDGTAMDILLSAIGDRDAQGGITRSLAVSIDVTERNRAEAALKQAKEALSLYSRDLERQVRKRTREISSILAYTPAVVYIKDRQGRYLLVNTRYEQLFGVKAENVRGKTDYAILPAPVADQFRANDHEVLRENRSGQFEEVITQEEGQRVYLSVKFPVYDEAGSANGVCSISTDITAVKKAQVKLRRLSGSIMASQEKERAAIARELHDELGQVLTALRMDSVWLLERLKAFDDEATRRVLTMCRLIDTTIEEVRGMAFRLRPGVLDDLGLVDALEVFTSDFERRTGIPCVFEHPDALGPSGTDDVVATAAYRITQEALTNVARHAAAGHVDVILRSANGRLSISVSDDGQGFCVTELSEAETLGVAVMRERASLVGGRLQIDSRPGRGTRVVFEGPLSSGVQRHDQGSFSG